MNNIEVGILVFPGSNCDTDCFHALNNIFTFSTRYIWHEDVDIHNLDLIVIPGGFSYGDYLRPGALAKFSPVIKKVKKFAENGGTVLGICNGFQILTEMSLLPGALITNENINFICKDVELRVDVISTPFTSEYELYDIIKMPIAHHGGRYYADEDTIFELEKNNQIVFRYMENPNGSSRGIAGIRNLEGNVLGLMPHPERCVEEAIGGTDGLPLFKSLMEYLCHAKDFKYHDAY